MTLTPALADAADAIGRLSRLHGPSELRAAALALATQPRSAASLAAWSAETADLPSAQRLLKDVQQVPGDVRLPALDVMLRRLRPHAKPERRQLLLSARRLMASHAPRRPLDRLHWLVMRRRLGDTRSPAVLPDTHRELSTLPGQTQEQLARVTAYLSRMVPDGDAAAGRDWYADALARLMPAGDVPEFAMPDGDGFVHALEEAESLPWMLRPVLVRAWVDAAGAASAAVRLDATAADALRLAADLLDSPLPPQLARQYVTLNWG